MGKTEIVYECCANLNNDWNEIDCTHGELGS